MRSNAESNRGGDTTAPAPYSSPFFVGSTAQFYRDSSKSSNKKLGTSNNTTLTQFFSPQSNNSSIRVADQKSTSESKSKSEQQQQPSSKDEQSISSSSKPKSFLLFTRASSASNNSNRLVGNLFSRQQQQQQETRKRTIQQTCSDDDYDEEICLSPPFSISKPSAPTTQAETKRPAAVTSTRSSSIYLVEGSMQGPSSSAEYGNRNKRRRTGNGMSMEGYWENRMRKLAQQGKKVDANIYTKVINSEILHSAKYGDDGEAGIGAHSGADDENMEEEDKELPPPIAAPTNGSLFRGLCIYFNGRLGRFSQYHLGKLVQLHGGIVSPLFGKKRITHVVCTNLCGSKSERVTKEAISKYPVKYVHPDWIVNSIKEGKLLKESDYFVVKDKATVSVASFFRNNTATTATKKEQGPGSAAAAAKATSTVDISR